MGSAKINHNKQMNNSWLVEQVQSSILVYGAAQLWAILTVNGVFPHGHDTLYIYIQGLETPFSFLNIRYVG